MNTTVKNEIQSDIFNEIVSLYRNGTTLKELESKYNIPYHILYNRLAYIVKINVEDKISCNLALIMFAESKLIEMAKEIKQGEIEKLMRYNALLFWTSKADLNGGNVFIPENLLS